MKHNIRYHVVTPIVGKRVKTETVIGELGSGILDKNGKEIFEGDKIKIGDSVIELVEFYGGRFQFDVMETDLQWIVANEVEIVDEGTES